MPVVGHSTTRRFLLPNAQHRHKTIFDFCVDFRSAASLACRLAFPFYLIKSQFSDYNVTLSFSLVFEIFEDVSLLYDIKGNWQQKFNLSHLKEMQKQCIEDDLL